MVFYNFEPIKPNLASSNVVTGVKPVGASASIVAGLNERFASLSQGQNFSGEVASKQHNQATIKTEFGNLTLLTDFNFSQGQKLSLSVISKHPDFSLKLQVTQNSNDNLVTDLIISRAEKRIIPLWLQAPSAEKLAELANRYPQLSKLLPVQLPTFIRGKAKFSRKSVEEQEEKLLLEYTISNSSSDYSWLETDLGDCKIASLAPKADDWCLELVAFDNEPITVLFNNSELLIKLCQAWDSWQQLVAQQKLPALVTLEEKKSVNIGHILLSIFNLELSGYSTMFDQQIDQAQLIEEPLYQQLLLDAKIIDNFHQLYQQRLIILPLAHNEGRVEWLRIWRRQLGQSSQRWQLEWDREDCGQVQLIIEADNTIASNDEYTHLNVTLFTSIAPDIEWLDETEQLFKKLCKAYMLWGKFIYNEKPPEPTISEQLSEILGRPKVVVV